MTKLTLNQPTGHKKKPIKVLVIQEKMNILMSWTFVIYKRLYLRTERLIKQGINFLIPLSFNQTVFYL